MCRLLWLFCMLLPLPLSAADEGLPPGAPQPEAGRVYDISLHDPGELMLLLRRLEQLSEGPQASGTQPSVALVLHGPELAYFARDHYDHYRELVDLAARLDAFHVIEVKACRTRMKALGLKPEDMPAFIELVPYGPDEVERLRREGYLVM
ncbi:DsrE family protein [Thiohalobacter sp.]|uniref:DsrE family protein n=1 Tax=Thiohalobacter sp. TaxID=2025948 RepID=UPI002632B330|nr:hypothetical protein [Thiohalobacter sp.]